GSRPRAAFSLSSLPAWYRRNSRILFPPRAPNHAKLRIVNFRFWSWRSLRGIYPSALGSSYASLQIGLHSRDLASQFRHSRMLLAGIQAESGLDPRLKYSRV